MLSCDTSTWLSGEQEGTHRQASRVRGLGGSGRTGPRSRYPPPPQHLLQGGAGNAPLGEPAVHSSCCNYWVVN